MLYLARRNPALARGAFAARWRQHAALAIEPALLEDADGYFHCDVLDMPTRTEDPHTPQAWTAEPDGVGSSTFLTVATSSRCSPTPQCPVLLADEWGAFQRTSR